MAWTGEVNWPTFYRAGPSRQYQVLDELDRGSPLEVLSCQSGWCRVQSDRSIGWVEQAAISAPATLLPKPAVPATTAGCFDTLQRGYGSYGKGELWRLCPRPAG